MRCCFWKCAGQSRNKNYMLNAIITALLVHIVLLVLFRPVPRRDARLADELPKVGSIDLTAPGNQQLKLWIANHDPAWIIAADHQHGSSAVLKSFVSHPEPEDLQIAKPLSKVKAPVMPGKVKTLSGRKTPQILYWNSDAEVVVSRTPSVWLNGKNFAEAEKLLAEELPVIPDSAGTTVIYIDPVNMPQLNDGRIKLLQSSSSEALDKLAGRIIRSCIAKKNFPSGEAAFVWNSKASGGNQLKERKL